MSYTAICNNFFLVHHTQRSQTPIKNTNQTNSLSQWPKISTPFWKQIHIKTLQSICTLFQQYTPQQHTSSCTPFYMSFRQPQMQRHQRYFDCKCLKETPPQNIDNRRFNRSMRQKHIRSRSPKTLQ